LEWVKNGPCEKEG
jgi:hypothetical protein